jgi:hypothetical protein
MIFHNKQTLLVQLFEAVSRHLLSSINFPLCVIITPLSLSLSCGLIFCDQRSLLDFLQSRSTIVHWRNSRSSIDILPYERTSLGNYKEVIQISLLRQIHHSFFSSFFCSSLWKYVIHVCVYASQKTFYFPVNILVKHAWCMLFLILCKGYWFFCL